MFPAASAAIETFAVICTSSASSPSSLKYPLYLATPPLRNDMSGFDTAMVIFCAFAVSKVTKHSSSVRVKKNCFIEVFAFTHNHSRGHHEVHEGHEVEKLYFDPFVLFVLLVVKIISVEDFFAPFFLYLPRQIIRNADRLRELLQPVVGTA